MNADKQQHEDLYLDDSFKKLNQESNIASGIIGADG